MKINWLEKIAINNFLWASVQRKFIVPIWAQSIQLPAEAVVLEVGCGRGAGSVILLEEFKPPRVDAFDVDEDMIRQAQEYIPADYKSRINVSVGDIMNIRASDNTYDAVFDFFTLHHVEDWRRGVSEISRVLKPGGYFAFAELYGSAIKGYFLKYVLKRPVEERFERGEWVRGLAENKLRLMEKQHRLGGRGLIGVARKS